MCKNLQDVLLLKKVEVKREATSHIALHVRILKVLLEGKRESAGIFIACCAITIQNSIPLWLLACEVYSTLYLTCPYFMQFDSIFFVCVI